MIKAFDYIEGWGPFYTEGYIHEGPKVFAGRIDERCKKVMKLRTKYADRGDNLIKESYSKEEEILRRIYSERVLKKTRLLNDELKAFVYADIPGAFGSELITQAWAANGAIDKFLESSEFDEPWFVNEENVPYIAADKFQNVLITLDPLFSYAMGVRTLFGQNLTAPFFLDTLNLVRHERTFS